ncbi:hypothetical protein D3C73_882340 [compost metagenome]
MRKIIPRRQELFGRKTAHGCRPDTRSARARHIARQWLSGLIALTHCTEFCLLLADARQRLPLAVELGGGLTDGGFQAALVGGEGPGVNPGLRQLLALTLHRLTQPVIFELQLGGRAFGRLHQLRLCAGRLLGIFKLHRQRGGFLFGFCQRLTGDRQLSTRFTESLDAPGLCVQLFKVLPGVADFRRQRFTRCLDAFKRAARLVNGFE